jgi:hypothetical protein
MKSMNNLILTLLCMTSFANSYAGPLRVFAIQEGERLNVPAPGVLRGVENASAQVDGGEKPVAAFAMGSDGSLNMLPIDGFTGKLTFPFFVVDKTRQNSTEETVVVYVLPKGRACAKFGSDLICRVSAGASFRYELEGGVQPLHLVEGNAITVVGVSKWHYVTTFGTESFDAPWKTVFISSDYCDPRSFYHNESFRIEQGVCWSAWDWISVATTYGIIAGTLGTVVALKLQHALERRT